ncbi:WxcM-like domain-containing protein [Dysgonomonas sp. 511]|nr:WxcM-like domain-containing protein [Dysgonomonas sp. 511]
MATVEDCTLVALPKIQFDAGNITPVQSEMEIPFEIARVFYLYDIPGGERRGGHAHKRCHQLLVAASGSFDVELDDGRSRRTVTLNLPDRGLYIPPGIWALQTGFSSGSICLVLNSIEYNEDDYIRNYDEFLALKGVQK